MVKEEPVSLLRQTIYCLIPILDIYAAYKVRRLRKYAFIIIVMVGMPISIADAILFPVDDEEESLEEFIRMIFFYFDDVNHMVFSVLAHMGTVMIAICLIRRWSAQWNLQFSTSTK